MTASRVVTRHMSGANQLGSRPRAGWATEAHGPLECYRDFRQKYARATSQPFRRAGVFATSTRATGARLKLCQAQAVGRFPAESYSLPIPSFPLQPLRPHNARTRARRARARPNWKEISARLCLTAHQPYWPYPRIRLVSIHGHYHELGSPPARVVTSRMLEQLTYAQIGDRLNISSEGARAIVKRNRLPRSHDKNGKTLVAVDLDELQHKPF